MSKISDTSVCQGGKLEDGDNSLSSFYRSQPLDENTLAIALGCTYFAGLDYWTGPLDWDYWTDR